MFVVCLVRIPHLIFEFVLLAVRHRLYFQFIIFVLDISSSFTFPFFYWVRLNHILHLRLLSMHLLGKVRACLGQRAEEFLVVCGP